MVAFKTLIIFLLQLLIGYGVIHRLGFTEKRTQALGMSMMAGLGVSSVVVFLLEVVRIPIGFTSISLSLLLIACLFWKDFFQFATDFNGKLRVPKIYEFFFFAAFAFFLFISIWRCFYTPITPFDTKVGIDLVAKYAILEGTIASSVFSEHLPNVWYYSNQPFYAPFTMLMQVIFRSTGLDFGKLWLSFLLLGFLLFFYSNLKSKIHPVLAGVWILILFCIPEFFAYTFLVQTDFSNALFFATAVIMFSGYFTSQQGNKTMLRLSILFMCLAVWSRSETIVIVPLGTLLVLWKEYKGNGSKNWAYVVAYLAIPLVFFALWNFVYVKLYLPISPDTLSNLKWDFESYFLKLWIPLKAMIGVIMVPDYWNYSVWIFLGVYLLNLLIFRSFKGSHALLWLLVFFILFVFMIHHIPAVGVGTTFRRGFFKFLPLFLFVLGQIPLVGWLSDRISTWENK